MKISPLHKELVSAAAGLFIRGYRKQRLATPQLPALMEDQDRVERIIAGRLDACPGVAAVENDQLVGYMLWYLVDGFRGTDRKGAYVPEWGHACEASAEPARSKAQIYQALYRAAAEGWASAGCQVHALSLLAHDQAAKEAWFWNGFGLTVVDAIRPMRPLDVPYSTDLQVRKATLADAGLLAELDAEHWAHYPQPPVFMPPHTGMDAAANAEFLSRQKNSVWMSWDGNVPVGFLRFEGYDFDSVAILESGEGVLISGAYVRPAHRGRKVAVAMLDAALRDYQGRGFGYCAVNFESFNPEAAAFWPKYFEPVCYSVTRVPEFP